MKIQFLVGPKEGQIATVYPHPTLSILAGAGLIEFLPEPKPEPQTQHLTWTLERTPSSGALHVHVACSCGSADMRNFNPKPDFCFRHCNVFEVIPADLFAKGKVEWAKNAAANAKLAAAQAKHADRPYHFVIDKATGQTKTEFRP
jgi:hypothetical protein